LTDDEWDILCCAVFLAASLVYTMVWITKHFGHCTGLTTCNRSDHQRLKL